MIRASTFIFLILIAGSAVAQIAPDPWYTARLSYDEASEMLCQTLALAIGKYGVGDRQGCTLVAGSSNRGFAQITVVGL